MRRPDDVDGHAGPVALYARNRRPGAPLLFRVRLLRTGPFNLKRPFGFLLKSLWGFTFACLAATCEMELHEVAIPQGPHVACLV